MNGVEESSEIYVSNYDWLQDRLRKLEDIKDSFFQTICLYSLFEAYAQEYCGFNPELTMGAFTRFVQDFSKASTNENEFLVEYDPISIFYEYQDVLGNNYNLNFMRDLPDYKPETIIATGVAAKMVQDIKNSGIEKKRKDFIRYHKYVGMLYFQRNKLSHEHFSPSSSLKFESCIDDIEPKYHESIYGHITDDNRSGTTVIWQFDFPLGYIKRLFKTCMDNYFEYRGKNGLKVKDQWMIIPWTNQKMQLRYRKLK